MYLYHLYLFIFQYLCLPLSIAVYVYIRFTVCLPAFECSDKRTESFLLIRAYLSVLMRFSFSHWQIQGVFHKLELHVLRFFQFMVFYVHYEEL